MSHIAFTVLADSWSKQSQVDPDQEAGDIELPTPLLNERSVKNLWPFKKLSSLLIKKLAINFSLIYLKNMGQYFHLFNRKSGKGFEKMGRSLLPTISLHLEQNNFCRSLGYHYFKGNKNHPYLIGHYASFYH